MNLSFEINGRRYIPLRAAPFVTSHLLHPLAMARRLADPEAYAVADDEECLVGWELCANGTLRFMSGGEFSSVVEKLEHMTEEGAVILDQIACLFPGVCVEQGALRAHFDVAVANYLDKRADCSMLTYGWVDAPLLLPNEYPIVIAGFEHVLSGSKPMKPPRANGIGRALAAISTVLDQLEEMAEKHGVHFDRRAIPESRQRFAKALFHAFPELSCFCRGDETLKGWFFRIGCEFRSGRPRLGQGSIVEIMMEAKSGKNFPAFVPRFRNSLINPVNLASNIH